MKQLLLEIYTENNSPESIKKYDSQLEKLFLDKAVEYRLSIKNLTIDITSKRLILVSTFENEHQNPQQVEVKGPAKDICFDEENNPTYIYKKFIKQKCEKHMELTTKIIANKEYMYLIGKNQTLPVEDVLEGFIKSFLDSINIHRNIKNLLVIYHHKTIKFNYKNIESSNYTIINHQDPGLELDSKLEVKDAKNHRNTLMSHGIILSRCHREEHIKNQLSDIKEAHNLIPLLSSSAGLINLSEDPCIYMANLGQPLALPDDILIFSLKHNPRVVFFKKDQKISQTIGLILDRGVKEKTVSNYTKSVERKVFEIQRIYFKEMENHFIRDTNSLKNIVFLEDLGTMYDKVQRVKHIAGKISDLLNIGEPINSYTKRAAELSKNDLTNPLVALYPQLHGIVAKHYALKWGESQEVALAIEEYILPIKYQPKLPQTMAGSILSIADKIDTIVGLYSVGLQPQGNDDIYKLKVKADGIIRIIDKTQMDISLKRIINLAINLYESFHVLKQKDKERLLKDILEFFNLRIKKYMEKQKFDTSIVEALVANQSTNITLIMGKGEYLHKVIDNKELKDTTILFNRLKNLIGDNPIKDIELEFLTGEIETKLYENFLYHKKNYYDKVDTGDFEGAFFDLHSLNYSLEKFLNKIYVYTDDEAVRINRINMLTNVYDLYLDFCDFSKLKSRVVNKK